jgi:hypothetical protein
MLEAKSLLSKEGNSLVYKFVDGTVIKKFRKAWEANEGDHLDLIMRQWNDHDTDSVMEELNTQDDPHTILEE